MAKKFQKTSCNKCKKVFEYEVGLFKSSPESAGFFGYICPDCSREKKLGALRESEQKRELKYEKERRRDDQYRLRDERENDRAFEGEARRNELVQKRRLRGMADKKSRIQRRSLETPVERYRREEKASLAWAAALEREGIRQEYLASKKLEDEEKERELIRVSHAHKLIWIVFKTMLSIGITWLIVYQYNNANHWYSIAILWTLKWFMYIVATFFSIALFISFSKRLLKN